MYIESVKTDIVNNLKSARKLNFTATEHAAFLSLPHNDDIIIRPGQIKDLVSLYWIKSKYMEKLKQEMDGSESYIETEEDLIEVAWKKVKKLVN